MLRTRCHYSISLRMRMTQRTFFINIFKKMLLLYFFLIIVDIYHKRESRVVQRLENNVKF